MKYSLVLALTFLVLATSSPFAEETAPMPVGDAYPLDTCPVSGKKLGSMGDPVILMHEGREIRLCCGGCVAKVKADPAAVMAKVDAAIIAAQKADYPLDVCPVSGKKLGSGDMTPVDIVVGNRLVRLCCADCKGAAEKDPKAMIAKIDAAVIAKQKASYPLETCVITGKELGKTAVDFVHANRLIRLCCPACVAKVRRDPAAAIAKIDAATKTDEDDDDADEDDDDDGGMDDDGAR